MTKLCSAQQAAFDGVQHALQVGNVAVAWGAAGSGKSTVLRELQRTLGGALITIGDLVDAIQSRHPLALEETFARIVFDALKQHDAVFIDELDLLSEVVSSCHSYPRTNFLEAPLTALATYAAAAGKKLIFAGASSMAVRARAYQFGISEYTSADYQFLCHEFLGDLSDRLDLEKVFRFAPKLNAHQLRAACHWLKHADQLDTQSFINYLRSQYLASNVDLGEVQDMGLHDLKGVDDIIRSLEANIILPLENDELAKELGLKPKRGVLLAGPPGTGKTSVGRALAHRLQSKFFLVDGTFISGTYHFYNQIQNLFENAKKNAPSIIFIDDSDAIFESGEELGLYRYLLTMLDGESASAGRVCVMLTAMDISHLPPALIRSGRIELWLTMQLPDAKARQEIVAGQFARIPALADSINVEQIGAATEGFTGADLKRLVEDGKIMLANDKAHGNEVQPLTSYFMLAAESIRASRQDYSDAEERATKQRANRPPRAIPQMPW